MRSEEDRFQRELEVALAESCSNVTADVILTNPVLESENVEPEVEILGENGRGTLGPFRSSIVYHFYFVLQKWMYQTRTMV